MNSNSDFWRSKAANDAYVNPIQSDIFYGRASTHRDCSYSQTDDCDDYDHSIIEEDQSEIVKKAIKESLEQLNGQNHNDNTRRHSIAESFSIFFQNIKKKVKSEIFRTE